MVPEARRRAAIGIGTTFTTCEFFRASCWRLQTLAMLPTPLCSFAIASQLLIRLNNALQPLEVTDSEATRLAHLMETVYIRIEHLECSRPYYEAIHGLDSDVGARVHPDARVNDTVGVLVLTNEGFRDLIAQICPAHRRVDQYKHCAGCHT